MTSATITIGTVGTFTNDASINISSTIASQLATLAGDQVTIYFEPGVYGVTTPILLPSNTSVIGNNSTLQVRHVGGDNWMGNTALIANKDDYSTSSTTSFSDGTVDTNISIRGMTFNDQNFYEFGSWFINATNIDVQDNTYIGGGGTAGTGPDGNAFTGVTNAIVADNISIGDENAAYDNWDGPTNVTIEDNSSYMSTGWSVLVNACTRGSDDPNSLNPNGDALNDGVIGNVISGYSVQNTGENADPLNSLSSETSITQQGNLISSLDVPNAGQFYSGGVVSGDILQDNIFTGLNYSSYNPSAEGISINSASFGEVTTAAQMLGNLIFGASNANANASLIFNGSTLGSTIDNADINQSSFQSNAIANAASSSSTLAGNILTSGTTLAGSGILTSLDITAPSNLFPSVGTSTAIFGLAVDDLTSSDTLSVTLRTVFGSLTVPGVASTIVGGENALVISGNLSTINTDLGELAYTSNAGGWDDSIEINVSDNTSGLSSTRYIPVLVGQSGTSIDVSNTLTLSFMGTLAITVSSGGTYLAPEPTLNGSIAIESSGNNSLAMGSSISVAFLGSGTNTVQGGVGQEYIAAGSGEAIVTLAQAGTVTVAGNAGPLIVNASAGNNLIETGSSNATIAASSGSNTVIGGLGNMTVTGGNGPLFVTTLPEDGGLSFISGGSGNSTIFALSGQASINTQANTANLIYGGIGTVSLTSSGNNTFYGGAGSATVNASTGGSDIVIGGSGSLAFLAGSSSTSASTVTSGSGNLNISTSGALVSLTISPTSTSPTITLPGLMNGVSLSKSLTSESMSGQYAYLTLSDGTHVTVYDPSLKNIAEVNGQLVYNPLQLQSNSLFTLMTNSSSVSTLSIVGAASGGDTINTMSNTPNVAITTAGSSNVIGLSNPAATVKAGGTGDLINTGAGSYVVSVTGSQVGVINQGSADTIYAGTGSSGVDAFFYNSTSGGKFDFINQSSVAASVTGGAAGSVTVFGGVGGGYYQGGSSGNNSLIGGSGSSATTLIGGAGNGNFLSVGGSGNNALFTGNGSATVVAASSTTSNIFEAGTAGTDSVVSYGSGTQNFFVGTGGSETMVGSNVAGAINNYYFQETAATGGGADGIVNFNSSRDHGYINPFGQSTPPVTIMGCAVSGGTTQIDLSDNTTIRLYGVSFSSSMQTSIIGGTSF